MTEHRMFTVDLEGRQTDYVVLQRPLIQDNVLFFIELLPNQQVRQWAVPVSQIKAAAWETEPPLQSHHPERMRANRPTTPEVLE